MCAVMGQRAFMKRRLQSFQFTLVSLHARLCERTFDHGLNAPEPEALC